MTVADAVILFAALYASIGVGFAMLFVARGVGRVDPVARSAGVGFRLVILPGAAVLWPVLLRLWWRSSRRAPA
ncbi:MAG: hypothetical protein IBJ11_03305 [Phycisphaerales bacterium]|nr:hypothetical protein [Phycisphaerales bacterium]